MAPADLDQFIGNEIQQKTIVGFNGNFVFGDLDHLPANYVIYGFNLIPYMKNGHVLFYIHKNNGIFREQILQTVKMYLSWLLMDIEKYMLPCYTKKLWGFDCPGCGLQRSLVFLLKGDFISAFEMYPAIYTILPLITLLLLDGFTNVKINGKLIVLLTVASITLILGNYILKFI